jgi:hypothetical protein
VGLLAARSAAVVRVGATVKHDAAHPAVQSASRRDGMLQLSVTLRTLGWRYARSNQHVHKNFAKTET